MKRNATAFTLGFAAALLLAPLSIVAAVSAPLRAAPLRIAPLRLAPPVFAQIFGPTGSSGANTALSNLSGVAVNASLIPGSTSLDIGGSSNPWLNGYFGTSGSPLIRLHTVAGFATISATSGRILFGSSWFSGNSTTNILSNDAGIYFGDAGDKGVLIYATAHTVDPIFFALGTGHRLLVIGDSGDQATDSGLSAASNPTLVVQSADHTKRIGIRHNQTNGQIVDLAATAANARPVGEMEGSDVASAATITPTGNFFTVTGTTTIDTITIQSGATCIRLLFSGACSVGDLTGNIDIGAAFTSTANDTLSLCAKSTTWYEVGRSVN